MFKHTCMNTFILSSGAVPVRDTAPAMAPADSCFHHRPLVFSSSVNSSGIARLSPMSSTYSSKHPFMWGCAWLCHTLTASERWIKPHLESFCWPLRDGFLEEEIGCKVTFHTLTNIKNKNKHQMWIFSPSWQQSCDMWPHHHFHWHSFGFNLCF